MSNNDFDNDQVDFDDNASADEDFAGGGNTLGDMWRNNPLVKIGVIAGGLITVIGAIILFGGSEEKPLTSQINTSDEVKEAPGGVVSEAYKEAIKEGTIQRTEEAIRQGGSVLPTPIDTPVTRLNLPQDDLNKEDPLERWRRIQEERQRQTAVRKAPEQIGNPNAEAIDALASAMAAQMEGILDTKQPLKPIHIAITEQEWLDQLRAEEAERLAALREAQQQSTNTEDVINILIPAGEIEYAQLVIEANSDIENGPVLAHLVSGPFSGARLLGDFEVEGELLFLTFDVMVIDGIGHPITAVALDPDTTLPGLATEVDHRYFRRVVLPAAAAFVEGFGEAIADTNETSVTVDGGAAVQSQSELDTREELFKGLEKSAEKIGEILDEEGEEVEILVRVAAGTPMGILFLDPVTDETN